MSYTLKVSEKQLYVILRSLDLMNRIHMGQVETVYQSLINNKSCKHDYKKANEILTKFKEIEFPLLFGPEHYSIHSDEVPEEAKIGWDLVSIIRHKLWQEGKAETISVYGNPPDKIAITEDLAEISSNDTKRTERTDKPND